MRDKYHSLGMWAEYRFWRNRTKHIIDTSKQKYYNDMIKDSKDSKTLWKCIHSLNPSNPSKPHELITTGDHKTTDNKEIANTFNNYFTSCVEKLRHSRAQSNSNFNTLTNYVQMKFLKKRHNKFIIPPVKVSELFAEITKLDVKTSSGSDNIGPKIFKLSAPFIASSLTYILNRMIDTVIESGDDLTSILDKEALVLVNHQSTSDVPILMSSMYPKGVACGSMTWVMDYIFKFTNFGWISYFHEDFFICQGKDGRDEELVKLKKHMLNSYLPTGKKWIVVFPEGGFLYKRRKSSQQYAKKHNFPVLEHVTLPRIGAVKVITDSLYHDTLQNGVKKESLVPAERKLKWVIDITIGYPDRDSLSFPGMMAGIYSPRQIHVHYRAYPITEVPHDSNHLQTWLYDRYIEKEEFLEQYYNNKTSMNDTDKEIRHLPRLSEQEIKEDYHGI
ncbi:lysocardiolipin and lysophospholipid acyltransferase, partial [Mytilus galloprovincialis]